MRHDYMKLRRERVDGFCERHFSFPGTCRRFKRALRRDAILVPLNTLLALPLGCARKGATWLAELGSDRATRLLDTLPAGIPTARQAELELVLWTELFEAAPTPEAERIIQAEIRRFAAARAAVAEVVMTGLSGMTGYLLLNELVWNPAEIAQRLVQARAQRRAISEFFLGEGPGAFFYNAFPVTPSELDVFWASVALIIGISGLVLVAGLALEPIQHRLGIQRRRLRAMLGELELKLSRGSTALQEPE